MARLLITGCGGPASMGVTRCLRKSGNNYIVGTDSNPLTIPFSETDVRYLVPPAGDVRYIPILNRIIEAEQIEFIHAQPDPEVAAISRDRDRLKAKVFLPRHETIDLCQDKFRSFERWRDSGVPVPDTMLLRDEADLHAAFARFRVPFWIRALTGAAGRGSFIVRGFGAAHAWIDSWEGWGNFIASEMLPGRLVTWQSLWREGELICAQSRERLAWALGNRTPTGVTGVTGVARTISRTDLDEIAERAILAVDDQPNGIFGVDLKENADGTPCVTEINIGRFFTTIQFFAELGLNMPQMLVDLAFGGSKPLAQRYNPLENDVYWLRSMDSAPRLFRRSQVAEMVKRVGDAPVEFEIRADRTVTYV